MRLTRFLPMYLAAASLSAIRRRTPGAWTVAAAIWLPPILLAYLVACGVPVGAWDAAREGRHGAALALFCLTLGPLLVLLLLGRLAGAQGREPHGSD
ncbi:Flp pilus assembly protein TadG [Roseospira marina]|nr:Flp pilus assembly protein TadG [Roseospira marina]MBB5085493.1 Flp pilus assembly protein TadG [Roseospira marina]